MKWLDQQWGKCRSSHDTRLETARRWKFLSSLPGRRCSLCAGQILLIFAAHANFSSRRKLTQQRHAISIVSRKIEDHFQIKFCLIW